MQVTTNANSNAPDVVDTTNTTQTQTQNKTNKKLLKMLNIFPGVNLSMMHFAMGSKKWRVALEEMLRGGQIIKVAVVAPDSNRIYTKFYRAEDVALYERVAANQHNLTVIK